VGTYTWQGMRAKHVPLLVYIVMHAIVDPMTSVLLWYLISSILFPPSYLLHPISSSLWSCTCV
jgi:hypothetical protein